LQELLRLQLGYTQTNGTRSLRNAIAALYPSASAANVLVCNGTSEANYVSMWRLVEPGDEVVVMLPNYLQVWGIVRGQGADAVGGWLGEDRAWAPDFEELRRLVTPRTRIIAVCNPNNPAGSVLTDDAMTAIVNVAARQGIWVVADEVYRGAELDG